MPGKLKVYGKKGSTILSDAFEKLSESSAKKDGYEYRSFESAEALVSKNAMDDVGGDSHRRAPLRSKGSNAPLTKRETGKLEDEERLAFDHMLGRASSERLGERADEDRSRQDLLEHSTADSDRAGAELLGRMKEALFSSPRSKMGEGSNVAELEGRLRNTRLDSSTRILNRNTTEETTNSTGFPARERFSRFTRGRRAAPNREPESSLNSQQENFEAEKQDGRRKKQSKKSQKKQAMKTGRNDSEDDLILLTRASTLSEPKSESEASIASWAASSIRRRARSRDSNVLEIQMGVGTNRPPPEVTYLSKENGTMRFTRAPLREPAPEASYLSTENGTMRTRRGPVRAPVTRPAASTTESIVNTDTLEYLSPLLEVAKGRVDETPVCSFRDWIDRLCQQNYDLVKVGEGSFGETYRTKITPEGSTEPILGETIFKVIPLRARSGVGSRTFVPVVEAVSEVELLAKMTSIPGFTVYQEAYVVCGSQPPQIISACDAYIHSPNHRRDDRPTVKRYIPTQLWLIIEMQYAGTDLERVRVNSHWQTWDIFWGAAIALARAEVVARFEHRDLHLGNVCVQPGAANATVDGPLQLTKAEAEEVKLGFSGVEVTLIDYTLSRADMGPGHVAFNDLRDGAGICDRRGGGGQFDTYRRMRAEVFLRDPMGNYADVGAGLASAGAGWKQYRPRTNLLWLHFLLSEVRRRSRKDIEDRPRLQRLPGSDPNEVGSERRARRRCKELGDKLTATLELLNPETLTRSELHSAGDLVQYAVKNGWLNESDLEN